MDSCCFYFLYLFLVFFFLKFCFVLFFKALFIVTNEIESRAKICSLRGFYQREESDNEVLDESSWVLVIAEVSDAAAPKHATDEIAY